MKLVIMRGLPGSGKSTLANQVMSDYQSSIPLEKEQAEKRTNCVRKCVILSADDFFTILPRPHVQQSAPESDIKNSINPVYYRHKFIPTTLEAGNRSNQPNTRWGGNSNRSGREKQKIMNCPPINFLSWQNCNSNISRGCYLWDASLIKYAHMWNQQRARFALQSCYQLIIIDNTNVNKREVEPYEKLAKEFGYEVEYREPSTEWWVTRDYAEMAARNTHDVPEEKIRLMGERWEKLE